MRINVVDIIKGIAIIMIVNVHLISGQFFSLGSTFHVVAFFFASGIIHGISEKWNSIPVRTFVKQKATRLLYPYLTLSICYIIFHFLLNIARGDEIVNDVIITSSINTITFRGIGTLWFLPVMFGGEIIFYISKKCKIRDWISILTGMGVIFLSSFFNSKGICGIKWYGDNSLYGLLINTPLTILLSSAIASLFISIGFVFYKILPKSLWGSEISNKTMAIVTIICLISYFIDFLCLKYYSSDLHKLNIGDSVIFIICSLSGIIFVSSLSLIIERYTVYISSFLQFCGKNSLIIMTTHTEYYINSIAYLTVTIILSSLKLTFTNKLISGLSLCLIFIIEFGICYLVNHSYLKHLYIFPQRTSSK